MFVRHMDISDVDRVSHLMGQLAGATSDIPCRTPGIRHTGVLFDEMARSPETYLNLVAVESEGVVGFVSAIFYRSFFHEGGTAMINELVVDEARRSPGCPSPSGHSTHPGKYRWVPAPYLLLGRPSPAPSASTGLCQDRYRHFLRLSRGR